MTDTTEDPPRTKNKKGGAQDAPGLKSGWTPQGQNGTLFSPEELDIYVNKLTGEAYIFHGKKIDYAQVERLEYNPEDHSVEVVMKDATRLDLGVRIQWLVRSYFTAAREVSIVQTEKGRSIDGIAVPLIHKPLSPKGNK